MHSITHTHTPHLPDNIVLAIAGSAVGGALLLVVTTGVLLCILIMKLKLHSATAKLWSKLYTIQHEISSFKFLFIPST